MSTAIVSKLAVRPNRLSRTKDKQYHADYARWVLSSVNHQLHINFMYKCVINWNFYKNRQWLFNEDLQGFLMDESGDARNRIKFTQNIIRPIVEQFVGNAIRLDFNAEAINISDFASNRRETELGRMLFHTAIANNTPEFAEAIKNKFPIGETTEETQDIFDNMYVDKYQKDINNLLKAVDDRNDIAQDKKVILAKYLAITGVGILKGFHQNGEQVWKVTDPSYFIRDVGAQQPDLRDSQYMGECSYMIPTDIYERFQLLTADDRKAIENYNNQTNSGSMWQYGMYIPTDGRIPVYELYWKDIELQEYGYVIDDYGYELFARINYKAADEEKPKYTDKDLIKPKDAAFDTVLKGKKKKSIYVDVLRYCIFIPAEIIGGNTDIVCEYGLVPYQESYMLDPNNVEFPYKCYCWGYNNGDILSPVDDIIDTQRYINRVLSVAEASINNSRGSGTLIDKDMVDAQGGEEEVLRNINLSKPVFVNAKGNLNNSIGSYDFTIGPGTLNLFNIVSMLTGIANSVTGVNEAMQGTEGGSRKLVGVQQLEIQRGTLMQEPFYYALTKILLQCYQAIASQGKRIYADSQRKLSIMVGDKGAERITITKEMKLEDFRIAIKRTTSDDAQKQAANAILFQLLQLQLIDDKRFANYFNRATMDDVASAVREIYKEKVEVQRIQARNQNATAEEEAQTATQIAQLQHVQNEMGQRNQKAAADDAHDKELQKILVKEGAKQGRF